MDRSFIIFYRILLLLYIGAVCCLCFLNISTPGLSLDAYFLGIRLDKYAHFLMFLPFCPLLWINLRSFPSIRHPYLLTCLTGLGVAAFTEVAQSLFFTTREGDFYDFLADACAIVCGLFLTVLIRRLPFRILQHWKGR